jgi:hypothetical protein
VALDNVGPNIYVFKGKGDGTFTQTYTAVTAYPFATLALPDLLAVSITETVLSTRFVT